MLGLGDQKNIAVTIVKQNIASAKVKCAVIAEKTVNQQKQEHK